jgi:hypothetical protein
VLGQRHLQIGEIVGARRTSKIREIPGHFDTTPDVPMFGQSLQVTLSGSVFEQLMLSAIPEERKPQALSIAVSIASLRSGPLAARH